MAFSLFHPIISRWFAEALGEPTPAQTGGWQAIRSRRHTLIAAPTGSGKTLAAFLNAIDELFREGLETGTLPAETRVLYVSPLKALSTDIHKNLTEPLEAIRVRAGQAGLAPPTIRSAVRSGDTRPSERSAMLRSPPHILVTTPESLYLLLTAARSREMLRTVRTVIVDEIHAVLDSRRGPHLALSLERLEHVVGRPVTRIGLSATQRPIENVARFLVGTDRCLPDGEPDCVIVDEGHRRTLDLGLEIPQSPLEAVMAHEVWEEVYERLVELIESHRTTLVFVNTRRLAERLARHLSDRLGHDAVTAHHGSLSKEKRLDAEHRLRSGSLRALVATASLELGIDIGHVDLVCQIGSTNWISTFLQRVGRSGHTVLGTPKGRLFPLSRDDLIECTALLRTVRQGDLDTILTFDRALDVLCQQTVAEAACEDWAEEDLYRLWRGAYPYRELRREDFADVIQMAARGYASKRGRRGALIHYDGVNGRLRGRRGARMLAITAGGAIPDNADYRVVLEPEQALVGTVNEDFAVESMAGDVFQLGNASWRIVQIGSGTVRVIDAQGEPPNIPFWFGEAPARSARLSRAVSDLRQDLDARLDDQTTATAWLTAETGIPAGAAEQIVRYLAEARHLLGALPTQGSLVLERFFDESGGMQLVLHAPFGSRVNRAWGLALRKRFCRQFNFELQAAATENAVLLSLGPQHSFPLDDVFRYLHPNTVRNVLIQALLDAPMFQTRWRWNTTISLAIPRQRGGRRVPPQLQRMEAEDMMAAVFPDAAACLENIGGDREIPVHPLVQQAIDDCLGEVMDLPGLLEVLQAVAEGAIDCRSRDTPEPSVLCHEILNAMPYQFLDDAPLEERRTQAVYTRRAFEPSSANELGALDREAIARVADEAWPDIRDADELHDALLTAGFLTEIEGINARGESWMPLFEELASAHRATRVVLDGGLMWWVAVERLGDVAAVHGDAARWEPPLAPPQQRPDRDTATANLVRGRMEIVGPTTAPVLARSFGLPPDDIDRALLAVEAEGNILRGQFTPGTTHREWCDRRLLARIHRYTLNRLRAEIQPVSGADYMRFLMAWQKLDPEHRVSGSEGLSAVVDQLDGFEVPAGAWESDVLPARLDNYDPSFLDALCLTGRVAWARLSPTNRTPGPSGAGPVKSTPIALIRRTHLDVWQALAPPSGQPDLAPDAQTVLATLSERGATFFQELVDHTGLLATQVERALGALVAQGLVTSDSYSGLRALITPASKRPPIRTGRRAGTAPPRGVEAAGRWSLTPRRAAETQEAAIETQAGVLLRRYGVVFRRVLTRETNLAPWRELTRVYRRLEARGEIRGGRFVSGVSGEQFALPEAVGSLRNVRRAEPDGALFGICAADPLNLTGILTPGHRVPALATNRVVYRNGVPFAAREAGEIVPLVDYDGVSEREVEQAIARHRIGLPLKAHIGRAG